MNNMLIINLIATTFLLVSTKAQDMFNAPTFSPTMLSSNTTNPDLPDCGNGVCDIGENCLSCSVDCISGTSGGFECGNNICEDGETCYTCPQDCMSSETTTGEGEGFFCCYGGKTHPRIDNAVSCGDLRCFSGEVTCNKEESPLVTYCCGDGVCGGDETDLNCGIDNCEDLCGNGVCDLEKGENADTCGTDCTCNLDGICDDYETVNSCPLDCTCGDRVCNFDLGETVANCMSDCACNANYMCEAWEDKKNCPKDCGNTAAYGHGEGHDAEEGYDGMYQQLDGDAAGSGGYSGYNDYGNNYDSSSSGYGGYYGDSMGGGMNGGGYGSNSMGSVMNGGDCKDTGEECTDNNECCSSACDTYVEDGPTQCVG